MTKPVWIRLSSGRAIDLCNPNLAAIDLWADLAMPLAGLIRFGGHAEDNQKGVGVPHPIYSVAQHCVVGADALLEETGNPTTALAFLMHDAHEALLGDIASPVSRMLDVALGSVITRFAGADALAAIYKTLGAGPLAVALRGAKNILDREMYKLCGLPEDLPDHIAKAVHEMDVRMLDTERRQILGPTLTEPFDAVWPPAVLAARPVRLRGELRPWPRGKAAVEWFNRFEAWRIPRAKAA